MNEITIPIQINNKYQSRVGLGKVLLIKEGEKFLGCLSEQTLLQFIAKVGSIDHNLQALLPIPVVKIQAQELHEMETLWRHFQSPHCDSLVVIDEQDQLVGVINKVSFLLYCTLIQLSTPQSAASDRSNLALSNQIIHELRSPLNVVMGKVESMKEGLFGEVSEAQKNALQAIEEASTRLLNCFDKLSRFDLLPTAPTLNPSSDQDFTPADSTPTNATQPTSLQQGRSTNRLSTPLILLADDSEANLSTFTCYLRAKGYRVVQASTGQEAIEMTQMEHPDLVLMDIQMPTLNGHEAIAQLRLDPNFVDLPIIALTGMVDERERCLDSGANVYLTKPVKLSTLTATIQQLLESSIEKKGSL